MAVSHIKKLSCISEDKYSAYKEKCLKAHVQKEAKRRGVLEEQILIEQNEAKNKLAEMALKKKRRKAKIKSGKTNFHEIVKAAEYERKKAGRKLPEAHIVSGGTVSSK